MAELPLHIATRKTRVNTKKIKKRISRYELAVNYQKMVNSPEIRSRVELARRLGISRAWITMVIRELDE